MTLPEHVQAWVAQQAKRRGLTETGVIVAVLEKEIELWEGVRMIDTPQGPQLVSVNRRFQDWGQLAGRQSRS